MWIKTAGGEAINSDQVIAIWVGATDRNWELLARYATEVGANWDWLIRSCSSRREAQRLLDSILDAIDAGKKVWVAPGSGETVEKE